MPTAAGRRVHCARPSALASGRSRQELRQRWRRGVRQSTRTRAQCRSRCPLLVDFRPIRLAVSGGSRKLQPFDVCRGTFSGGGSEVDGKKEPVRTPPGRTVRGACFPSKSVRHDGARPPRQGRLRRRASARLRPRLGTSRLFRSRGLVGGDSVGRSVHSAPAPGLGPVRRGRWVHRGRLDWLRAAP